MVITPSWDITDITAIIYIYTMMINHQPRLQEQTPAIVGRSLYHGGLNPHDLRFFSLVLWILSEIHWEYLPAIFNVASWEIHERNGGL